MMTYKPRGRGYSGFQVTGMIEEFFGGVQNNLKTHSSAPAGREVLRIQHNKTCFAAFFKDRGLIFVPEILGLLEVLGIFGGF